MVVNSFHQIVINNSPYILNGFFFKIFFLYSDFMILLIVSTEGIEFPVFFFLKFNLISFYAGQTNTSYSNIRETATNTKYRKNIVRPKPLFIRHRKHAIDTTTNSNIINNIAIEQTIPFEFTLTGSL